MKLSRTLLVLGCLTSSTVLRAVTPAPGEFAAAGAWLDRAFGGREGVGTNPPAISFVLAGQSGAAVLARSRREVRDLPGDARTNRREITWRDPDTALEISVETTEFLDWPAVEWVARFRNRGATKSPILEDIQALDGLVSRPGSGTPVLHWARGGVASFDDFAPQEFSARPGAKLHLQPGGGRSSSEVLPYFNLARPEGGTVLAIGWTGEWAADFVVDAQGQITARAGLAKTHLALEPGESIRTPRMLLLNYAGDRWRGQNLLRQFILARHRPTRDGRPLVAPITCGNWGATRAEVHLDNIQQILRHQLPIDYYWIDAEWYGEGGWPGNVGNWIFKRDLYPQGFKPLSDLLRANGRELMLWFEPERVHRDTVWHREHPEWLLGRNGENFVLNLGLPAARRFVTDFILDRIQEFGLGCYRQDFNIEPLAFWRAADAPDRQGITEIRYIEGLYAFWDELRQKHPGLLIDNCASGGRRLDFEATERATPFWRTDGPRDPIAHQCHTYGLLAWLPLSATSQDRAGDDYEFRSSMCSSLCLNWWVSGDVPAERIPASFPFDWARTTLQEYLRMREAYYGDYYPLTRYSQASDVWMAYQLDRPDQGYGWLVVLRRPDSPYESARLVLRGLPPEASYELRRSDTKETVSKSGAELTRDGLGVTIASHPGSVLIEYRRK